MGASFYPLNMGKIFLLAFLKMIYLLFQTSENLITTFLIFYAKMPKKLTYEEVKRRVEAAGEKLISTSYINNAEKIFIECKDCYKPYDITFANYSQGNRHFRCSIKGENPNNFNKNRPKAVIKKRNCQLCQKEFIVKHTSPNQILCSVECRKNNEKLKAKTGYYKNLGRKGGLVSAKVQNRRSVNEIFFSILCMHIIEKVLTNEPIFDDWDADSIFPDFKIAVSWNGAFHHKKLRDAHSLEQVLSRDKIKDDIIKRHGYIHYIINDPAGESKPFVRQEFEKFIVFLESLGIKLDEVRKQRARDFDITYKELRAIQKAENEKHERKKKKNSNEENEKSNEEVEEENKEL